MSLKEEEYVQAAKVLGLNDANIMFRRILPNTIGPIFVNLTLYTAIFILQEASLSFLGLGVPVQLATWGNILNAANRLLVITNYWWVWVPVGLLICLFVLCINFIGEGIRDATDVSQRG
jgi:peptide/nickel transport system permease protein